MELIKNGLKIVVNDNGELTSLQFNDKEFLHDGKNDWGKTFPIIFPSLAVSKGFWYEDKEYTMEKHGWWNKLEWTGYVTEDSIDIQTFKLADKDYPFSYDLNVSFRILNTGLDIKTSIMNLGRNTAYFNFGYHPAFLIDDKTKLNIKDKPLQIDFKGLLTKKDTTMDVISKMAFGKDYDTLVFKDSKFKNIIFEVNRTMVEVAFDSKNLQLWKPTAAKFLCIEPWYGRNDHETEVPNSIQERDEIITLESGKTFTAIMSIFFNAI